MKKIKYIKTALFSLILVFVGCQDTDYEFGAIVTPSNIQITAEILGVDGSNPNGDGSGTVNFNATADNALSYKFIYNGSESSAPSGSMRYDFSNLGLNTYTVTVVAIGTAGVSSTKTIQVEVLSTFEPEVDLLQKLYGFDPLDPNPIEPTSRTWRVKSSAAGHFGLGPVAGTVPTEWYSAGPNEKVDLGMYDDRYVFYSDGTFTHITAGDIFGRDPHIVNDLGATTIAPDGADIANYPFDDYTESWSLTGPSGIETINLTGFAFIGYYTGGNHSYEIFDRESSNEMILRTTDGASEFDWWFIMTSE